MAFVRSRKATRTGHAESIGEPTFNECFATDLETHEIIARVNSGSIAAQSIIEDYRSAVN